MGRVVQHLIFRSVVPDSFPFPLHDTIQNPTVAHGGELEFDTQLEVLELLLGDEIHS